MVYNGYLSGSNFDASDICSTVGLLWIVLYYKVIEEYYRMFVLKEMISKDANGYETPACTFL